MKNSAGQALVLVLLSLAVVLTLVLFILSRTVTDIAVSSREGEAIRAFSAAEAGVEQALVIGSGGSGTVGGATFNAEVSGFAAGLYQFTYPLSLASGESAPVWFVSHDENGNLLCDATHPCFSGSSLKVCWGREGFPAGSATTPAIELSVFYAASPGDYTTLAIGRAAFDPNAGRTASNSFAAPDNGICTIGEETFAFQKTIDFSDLEVPAGSYTESNGLQFARARLFYNSDQTQPVGFDVTGGDALPSQGISVASSGASGDANRKLDVFQGWPEAPSIFTYTVFSATDLSK